MQLTNYSFQQLPFSKLFKTYVDQFQKLGNFYSIDPFDEDAIARKINNYEFPGDRSRTVELLRDFNKQFDVEQAALDNIERLKKENAVAIVTGQQLGIYGGPLYTILKTLGVIHLARKYERKLDQPVVPVFWLADEDHDYDEVRSVHVLNDDELKAFGLPSKSDHLEAVAEMKLPNELQSLRDDLKDSLLDTDFSDDLWDILDTCFTPGRTFLEAFGHFISRLFSSRGLVLAGSNYKKVKEATKDYLKISITKADEIRESLELQSNALDKEYHQQVKLYDSNLFYLDDKDGRAKINRGGDGWTTDTGKQWQTDELIDEIESHPQKFSPNVFLRPILQDGLLPSIGYVAGPGEIAYYGQMKQMYSCFNLDMPVIFPRLSATLIEPAIDRILGELPFKFHEYSKRIEDLESDFVDRTEQTDIEAIFGDWKEKIEGISDPKRKEIAEIDPTLDGAAGKATAAYFNELNKLKGKVYRAVKSQEETQLNRIRRIKANLFPGDGLQERLISGIFYMNKYGLDVWDKVLKSLDENEQFDHHKQIYL